MAQRQLNPEQYFEIPEPVRARRDEMNLAADEALRVLEAIYEIFYNAPAPKKEHVPASQEIRDYEVKVAETSSSENPIYNNVPESAEVQRYAEQVAASSEEMEIAAREKISQIHTQDARL